MNLNILWFILIAVLFCVYFFLDGIDFGIGMLVPFLGRNDKENKIMIHAIGPTWGANEVWLITAGGAMFATFPNWYATLFSGFYPALFLLLIAFMMRGLGVEFREKAVTQRGKKAYNIVFGIGNLLIPLLLVVAIACLLRGVPIDESMEYTGTLLSLFSPFTLLAGLTGIAFFLFHGVIILELKNPNEITGAKEIGKKAGLVALILLLMTFTAAAFETDMIAKPISVIVAVISVIVLLVSYLIFTKQISKLLIVTNALFVATVIGTAFSTLYPRVMVSSTNPDYSLTIYNSSSTDYTLTVITIVTSTLLPIVIGYTIWMYYVFAKRFDESKDNIKY